MASEATIRSVLAALMQIDGVPEKPEVVRLAIHRLDQLMNATKQGAPVFSWQQPRAAFPGSHATDVKKFLHSTSQSQKFSGFNGVPHARNWANKHFGSRCAAGYSATASPDGRGQGAFVAVTKTKVAHEQATLRYQTDKEELEGVLHKFGVERLGAEAGPQADATTGKRFHLSPEGQEAAKKSKNDASGKENNPTEL